MRLRKVKDLIVPLSKYAMVLDSATRLQAFDAFKQAQASVERRQHQYRSILVVDKNNRFVGKLSNHDVIEVLEPHYKE